MISSIMMRRIARRLRNSRPLNYLSTTALKGVFVPFGGPPESLTKHLPRVGIVGSRLPNGRVLSLWSLGDDWIASQVFWRGWNGYEPETTSIFYEIACGASVVFDVGAHVGFYSLLAAHANPSARIIAFEPLPKAIERFRRNVAVNLLTNVELIECAVGEQVGTATFFHAPSSSEGIPSSSGLAREFFHHPYYLESVTAESEVHVTTIDEVVQSGGIRRVDLIKIDTETTESAVLAGASGVLERDRPNIIFEVLPGQKTGSDITRQLKPFGYKFYLLRKGGLERREGVEPHPTLWNYLARVEGN